LNTTVTPLTRRRGLRALVITATAAGLIVAGTGQATAAPAGLPTITTGTDGWIRVAHLSPDTKEVNVQLSALSGGEELFALEGVGYGAVSDYRPIPAGNYVVSMIPTTDSDSTPLISASVKIEQGKSITVAAFGANSKLKTRVFQDDLTSPDPGTARIRLVQASTITKSVDVQTSTGLLIADNAMAGSSTSYATVPAGPWDLELRGSRIDDVAPVQLANGSVNTLFVLDNASGGLTVMSILDSSSVGDAPVGGVETGGGALAAGSANILFQLADTRR